MVEDRVRTRLRQLSVHLADSEWLEDEFTAGDLMMGSVLLRLKRSGLLAGFSNLESFVARCEVRPAYARAFEDQLALFQKSQAP
jgi:glutathione S-transferase